MAEHIIKINRGAARLLVSMLSHGGWYTDPAQAARACSLMDLPELEQDPGDRKDDSPEFKAWALESVEFKVTERQRDTVKACIEAHSKVGRFHIGNRSMGPLLRAFGFEPKDG